MLLNNCKKILFSIIFVACSVTLFAATTDLSVRFLDKANEAFEDNNIEDAYKYVNQALAVAKDKEAGANVLECAETVQSGELQARLENCDEMSFIDIQMNLEFAFASMDEVALNLNIGLRDKIFVKQGGFENRASLIFAVGVENVVK